MAREKTERVLVTVECQVRYTNDAARDEAMKRLARDVPIDLLSCGAYGSYGIKRVKVVAVTPD